VQTIFLLIVDLVSSVQQCTFVVVLVAIEKPQGGRGGGGNYNYKDKNKAWLRVFPWLQR